MQHGYDHPKHLGKVTPKLVGTGQVFEVSAEALDRVQLRAVGRQPKDDYPMLEQTQGCLGRSASMIGSTVKNQNDATGRIFID